MTVRVTDEELFDLWNRGLFDQIAERVGRFIAGAVAARVYNAVELAGTGAELDDICGDAMVYMLEAINAWSPASGVPLQTWIGNVTEWRLIDQMREATTQRRGGAGEARKGSKGHKATRIPLACVEESNNPPANAHEDDFTILNYNEFAQSYSAVRSMELDTSGNMDTDKLRACITELTSGQQEVLEMFLDGYKLPEITDVRGGSFSNTYTLFVKGVKSLQEMMT